MLPDPGSLEIVTYPRPVLRQKAQPVDAPAELVRAVACRMTELMYQADGIGLAAPQVDLAWRMFVTRGFDEDDVDRVYINPELRISGELSAREEGCLSLPGINVQVRRPMSAVITATNLDGETFTLASDEFPARVWQHEFDHLNGVLIIDRLSPLDRLAVRKPLKELERSEA